MIPYAIKYDEEKYIKLRHNLHRIPELSLQEKQTKAFLLNFIKDFKNYEKIKITECAETGFFIDIVGELSANDKEPLTGIAFRCDLDGLPLQEDTNVEYKSIHDGVAHSCGHDGHMTILTAYLEYTLERIDKIPSNFLIRFIYQPAEEQYNGAELMIKYGCLEGISEIYGYHNNALYFPGQFGITEGVVLASCDYFEIDIIGTGGHGSTPYLCKSPIIAGTEVIIKLNQITSQNIDSLHRSVVSVCSFQSGMASNVIPEKAKILGSIRTLDKDTQVKIIEIIKEICDGIASANQLKIEMNITSSGKVLYNNAELIKNVVLPSVKKAKFLDTNENLPWMGSEDFSYYTELIPGGFIMLGAGDLDHAIPIHNPQFDYNDLATPYGVEMYVRILEQKTKINLI